MSKTSSQNFAEKNKDFKLPGLFRNLEPSVHLLHLSVLRQLSNRRAGTASTKTKGEVRGGGKKPWRQKGTGRARAGSIRSPLWVGGGITFGPKPRSYKFKLSKKERNLAIGQALVSKADHIVILKKLPELKHSKTKELNTELKSMNSLKYPLLLIAKAGEHGFNEVRTASNNLRHVSFKDEKLVGTFDILKASSILITEYAIKEFESRLSKVIKDRKAKVA